LPLADALADRDQIRAATKSVNVDSMLTGHRRNWLPVFQDPAGDGYYYDPDRAAKPGHFFYNFMEDNTYRFYPSLATYFLALSDFYQRKLIKVDPADP